MHPELEELIQLALADGQITDKERNIILKKAAENGIDAAEVEMILDGKQHQLEMSKPKQKEKIGNIKVCPACGGTLKPMEVECSSCGHHFTNHEINISLSQLKEKLSLSKNDNERLIILKSFTPNKDKEAIIDSLHYLLGQVVSENLNEFDLKTNNLLKQKAEEIILRSKIYFANDTQFNDVIISFSQNLDDKFKTSEYFKMLGKQKQKRSYIYTTLGLVISFGVFIILKKISPDLHDQQSITSKIWPIWLIFSVILIALGSYFNVDYKKHKKRFPFLENYK